LVEIVSPPDRPVILASSNRCYEIWTARPQIQERYCTILSRCVRGLSRKRCKIVTIADHSNQKSYMSFSSGGYFHQSCHVTGLRLPQLTSTLTNLLSSSSSRSKESVYVLPPAMCCRRLHVMFAMMHLRNFCQVSIEEVRKVMTRSPVKFPLSTETVKGVGLG